MSGNKLGVARACDAHLRRGELRDSSLSVLPLLHPSLRGTHRLRHHQSAGSRHEADCVVVSRRGVLLGLSELLVVVLLLVDHCGSCKPCVSESRVKLMKERGGVDEFKRVNPAK